MLSGRNSKSDSKLYELVDQARQALKMQEGMPLWRAYVCIEYAILHLKLRYKIDQETTVVAKLAKKKISRKKQSGLETNLLEEARSRLENIELDQDKKTLLQELRSCRDILKTLARYQE